MQNSINIPVGTLINGIKTVAPAVSAWGVIPALENVLLYTKNQKLCFRACNGNDHIIYQSDVDINIENFAFAIPHKITLAALNGYETENCLIAINKGAINLKVNNSLNVNIPFLDADDFVNIPDVSNPKQTLIINANQLNDIINNVLPFVGNDFLRPWMSGIMFYNLGTDLIAAATDNHYLSRLNLGLTSGISKSKDIFNSNLPQQSLQLLKQSGLPLSDSVIIGFTDNNYFISLFDGEPQIIGGLNEGKNPNIEDIIDHTYKHSIILNKKELEVVIKKSIAFTNGDISIYALLNQTENNGLNISVTNKDLNQQFSEDISINKVDEFSIMVGIIPKQLLKILKQIDTENIEIHFSKSQFKDKPIHVKPNSNIQNQMYLLKPVTI